MNWLLLAQILNFFLFALSLYYLTKRKPILLLPTLFVGMGLHGFNFLLGTIWFPFKIVNIVIFLFVIIKLLPQNIDKTTYKSFAIVFFISLINALFNLPDKSFSTGILQGPLLRPIIQLYTYFSTFSLIIFMPYIIKNKYALFKVDKYYMRISELIILVGIIHFIFLKLGLSFMPILRSSGENNEVAKFGAKGIIMQRIYGFTGEPKTLGTILLPYFFISFYKLLRGIPNKSYFYQISMIVSALFVIVQTYSSAALIGLFVTFVLGFALKFYSFNEHKIIRSFFFLVMLFLLGNVFIDRGNRFQNISYFDFLQSRTVGRLEDEIDERSEVLVLESLLTEAALPVMGFGPGMYVFHSPNLVFSSGINKIDSGWVTIFVDLGIIGVLFYLLVIIKVIFNRNKIDIEYKNIYSAYLLGFISVAAGMLGNNEVILFPLFLGFIISIYKLGKINVLKEENNN